MASTAKDRAFNRALLSQRRKLASETQKFDGPAKQYVRVYGWLSYIKDFINRRTEAGIATPCKYLTLPGPNMTDIGVLWNAGLIEVPVGKLKIAICEKEYAELVVTQLEELGVDIVPYGNQLLHEVLRRKNHPLREEFPFDVVNFDLCNALLTGTRKYSNLDALQWIFRLQRGQRFLLLLTTRANDRFDDDLVKLLKLNYDSVAGFKEAYNTKFEQAKVNPFNDSTLFSRLVFPKLIARYARTFGYKVIEHLATYYSRQRDDESNYYMLTHTLELEPLTPKGERDTFFPCFDKVPENEHQEKTRVLLTENNRDKAAKAYSNFVKELLIKPFVNVDELLDNNPALKATMQREEQALLKWWERVRAS